MTKCMSTDKPKIHTLEVLRDVNKTQYSSLLSIYCGNKLYTCVMTGNLMAGIRFI